MTICRVRKIGLLLAGFGFLASPFIVKGGMAESVFSTHNIPIPARKPLRGITSAQEPTSQPIKVAMATREDIQNIVSSSSKSRASFAMGLFSDKQARLYHEIFDLQREGKIDEANKRFAGLNNSVLMGHVLAERYLHPSAYKTSYKELSAWLEKYADHPQADRIYKLALSTQKIGSHRKLKKPISYKNISGNLSAVAKKRKTYISTKERSSQEYNRVRKLDREITKHVDRREPTLALNILSNDYAVQFIDNVEYDRMRAKIAAGYLFAGKLDEAARLSKASIDRSGINVPQAGWVKGLVHWQLGQYHEAAQSFEIAATSPYSSGWMISAAAYWASRAHMRAGNEKLVSNWLSLASTYPRTFYGLIATKALGNSAKFNWKTPGLSREDVKFIESTEHGLRASALIKAGQLSLAEAELQNINPGRSIKNQQSLIAYATYYKLPALSMRLGNSYADPKGGLYDAALYPVVGWTPENGYRVDQALINAIIRQESRFKSSAANPSGATGLMQLMPATANYISGEDIYHNPQGQHQLKKPEVNLEIGQTYIEKLLNHKDVGQDLLSLAIAYNAGPGNLSKWKRERAHMEDPLLFIETIPFNETRAFVERVLSNYWIYRIRLNQDTPSLDAVAKGKWARYATQDDGYAAIASIGMN